MIRWCGLAVFCILVLPLLIPPLAVSARAEAPVDVVVAPTGNDAAAGTIAQPLRTLEAAQTRVRMLVRDGHPVRVWLRAGHYFRATPLTLTADDSGTAAAPVVWASYPGDDAVLTGSVAVSADRIRPVVDPGLRGSFPAALRDRIRQINLDDIGVGELGGDDWMGPGNTTPAWPTVVQGVSQSELARYPNSGYIGITGSSGDATWRFTDPRPFQWSRTAQAWTFGYPGVDWGFQHTKVASLNAADRSVSLNHGSYYGVRAGQRFTFYNVPEELDQDSEYYLDRVNRILYFVPNGQPVRVTSTTQPLVRVDGAEHVSLVDLHFEGTRGNAVDMVGGSRILLSGGSFRNIGTRGVTLGAVTDSGVVHSRFDNLGAGGVHLGGGDRASLTPGRNFVRRSTFTNFATRFTTYRGAVDLAGVGNTVANNEIAWTSHLAVSLTGNDHLVENNYIHDVVQDSSDAGAIYGGRDWTEMGTVIRNNIVVNVGDRYEKDDTVAIYLDDMKGGLRIENNLVVTAPRGVQLSGAATKVHSNTFINTDIPVNVGAWGSLSATPGGELDQKLAKVPWRSEPWRKYGSVLGDYATTEYPERSWPNGNVITSNAHHIGDLVIVDRARNTTLASNAKVKGDAVVADPRIGYRIPTGSEILSIPGNTGVNTAAVGVDGLSEGQAPVPTPTSGLTTAPQATPSPTPSGSSSGSASPLMPPPGTGPRAAATVGATSGGAASVSVGQPVRVTMAYAGFDSTTDYGVEIGLIDVASGQQLAKLVPVLKTGAARDGTMTTDFAGQSEWGGRSLSARITVRHAVGHVVTQLTSRNSVSVGLATANPSSPTASLPATLAPSVPPGTGPRAAVAMGNAENGMPAALLAGDTVRVAVAYAGLDTFTDYRLETSLVDTATGRTVHSRWRTLKTIETRSGVVHEDIPAISDWQGATLRATTVLRHPIGHIAVRADSANVVTIVT